MNQSKRKTVLLLTLPFILYAVLGLAFFLLPAWVSKETSYLLGFALYWAVFGMLLPVLILGKQGFIGLLKDQTPLFWAPNWLAALLWLVVTGVSVLMYGQGFMVAPLRLILFAIPLAIINGFCEELFWRELYVRTFPDNFWLAVLYPALGFALWHFIPQMIFPAGDRISFVVSTFFLGLVYGFIAWRTGSARWTIFSHSLSGVLALSGLLAPSLLALLS